MIIYDYIPIYIEIFSKKVTQHEGFCGIVEHIYAQQIPQAHRLIAEKNQRT